ncbi:hypothetical protein EB796_001056 [Bugula neritina]|uniref:ANKH n=1 Tax=Bugula neritina TaxID=10212 RepID=A0A7J7KRD4_BUGNE|nr:hypothetical protein EB796_001056 [Bugula neritina]
MAKLSGLEEGGDERQSAQHTTLQRLGMLAKFMLPLLITNMVPEVAEQSINRGITSIASDEMITLLASYGLAYYVTKIFAGMALELRNVSINLVHCRQDNVKMVGISAALGIVLSSLLLAVGLSPLGTLLIQDLHRQSSEVSKMTCSIISYISPTLIIEAFVLFIVVLLFTPTRTEPVLVPVSALYAGLIGRLIVTVGFWYVLARDNLPERHPSKELLTLKRVLKFWFPMVTIRVVQEMCRPTVNLVISRNLARTVSKEAGAKAVAVLTTVYPTSKILYAWVLDLVTLHPTFHRKTSTHEKFPSKIIAIFSAMCIGVTFAAHLLLFYTPGVAYFIMRRIIGVTDELAEMSLTPLKVFILPCVFLGTRSYFTGIVMMKEKTLYLMPSAVFRLSSLVLFLLTLPSVGLSGAALGASCVTLSLGVEASFAGAVCLFIRLKPRMTCICLNRKKNVPADKEDVPLDDEVTKLTETDQ